MRLLSLLAALLLGAAPIPTPQSAAPPAPAAVFITWDGNPTTTVSVDWHLVPGTDVAAVEASRDSASA